VEIEHAELIAHLKKLPPLSAPLQQVLSLLNDNQSDWSTISKVMLKDPVLTGRVLQIANSSFYGLHRQVKDIEVACAMLGSETLRGLIYTLILLSKFRHGNTNSFIDYDHLWKHSLRVACLVKVIGRKNGQHPTTAFTIGLFHCLDLIIQDYFFRSALAEKLEKYFSDNSLPKDTKIYSMLDTDSWWLTGILLEHWQFPEPIVSVFRKGVADYDNKMRMIVVASSTILKILEKEKKISNDASKDLIETFQKNDIQLIDLQDLVIESEKLYTEMSSWMFN
jgi:HD-like signal output (HDOD) protein